jgi:hypothetical protein
MAKYVKKPVVIDAVEFNGSNHEEIEKFAGTAAFKPVGGPQHLLGIKTLEGSLYAQPGDMIIRGVKGEFYPCKPDIFAASYDPA